MDQKPSIGRIVHYVSYGTPKGEYNSRCVAAIITDVREVEDGVNMPSAIEARLKIFNPDGDFNSPWLRYSENNSTGSWHWPERV